MKPKEKQVGVNAARVDYHNYRLDTAFRGVYLRRLPDRTLVPSSEFEQRLREYEESLKQDELKGSNESENG